MNVFRRSEDVPKHLDDILEKKPKAVWLQLGVINEEAARRAEEAGLQVVMDRCPAIDIPRLGLPRVA